MGYKDDYRGLTISICAAVLVGAAAGGFLLRSYHNTKLDTSADVQVAAPIDPSDSIGADWEILVAMLKHEEGFRAFGYPDTRGFWTIGYGTKLPLTGADKNCVNHANLSVSGPGLTKSQGDCLLRYRLSGYYNAIWARWAPFRQQDSSVQMALLDMSYQLGVAGLLGFKLMLSAITEKDWAKAIVEARSSRWDKETPSRVDRVVKIFKEQEQEQT